MEPWIYLKSFIVGGALCLLGQLLIDRTLLSPARILSLYVVAGVCLGALGLYRPVTEWAGAGASVPLIGFGNILAEGVRKAVLEKGLIGAFSGGLSASSAGIAAALVFSFAAALLFRAKAKK